jgi:hypothetical protein
MGKGGKEFSRALEMSPLLMGCEFQEGVHLSKHLPEEPMLCVALYENCTLFKIKENKTPFPDHVATNNTTENGVSGVEQKELKPLCPVGGDAKWCHPCGSCSFKSETGGREHGSSGTVPA